MRGGSAGGALAGASAPPVITAHHIVGHLCYPDGTIVPVAMGSDGRTYAVVSHATIPAEAGAGAGAARGW